MLLRHPTDKKANAAQQNANRRGRPPPAQTYAAGAYAAGLGGKALIGAGADKNLADNVRPALSPRSWPRPLTRRALPVARRAAPPR